MTRIAAALCIVLAASLFAPTIVLQTAAQETPAAKSKTKQPQKAPPPEGSYSTEAAAKAACAAEPVVWVNSRSKVYHAEGTRDYGKTREGFYMCKAQADKAGFRPVRGNAPKGKDSKKKS